MVKLHEEHTQDPMICKKLRRMACSALATHIWKKTNKHFFPAIKTIPSLHLYELVSQIHFSVGWNLHLGGFPWKNLRKSTNTSQNWMKVRSKIAVTDNPQNVPHVTSTLFPRFFVSFPTSKNHTPKLVMFIELDDGKIYRKPLYLMVKTMVSCRFSLKPIHWDAGLLGFHGRFPGPCPHRRLARQRPQESMDLPVAHGHVRCRWVSDRMGWCTRDTLLVGTLW